MVPLVGLMILGSYAARVGETGGGRRRPPRDRRSTFVCWL